MSKVVRLLLSMGLAATLSACGGGVSSGGDTATPDSAYDPEGSQTPSESQESQELTPSESQESQELSAGEKANAEFEDTLSGAELLSALKEGGHVIYFRHAQTNEDYADQADPNLDLEDCETQRKLSDVGEKQAEDIGTAFTDKGIPVGDVITSDYCRSWKTADLAFGRHQKDSMLNFLPFEDYTDAQFNEMENNVMPLLTEVPTSGENTVIVGHDDIFEAATGIYPDPQGIAYVLKPDGQGGFDIVANLLPDEWMEL